MWLARPRAERMLEYRHETVRADLAAHHRFRDRAPLRVAITGASGLIGSALTPFLTTGGHTVTPVTRRRGSPNAIHWDPATGEIDAAAFEGLDAVVHLAGENVGMRWTAERKRRMWDSRVGGTRLLAETLARLQRPPRVLVSASAMGIYGNRGDELLTEDAVPTGPPSDFFVELGREWEQATEPARAAGIRVVCVRSGLILTPAGGALARMLPPFRLGVGGPIGNGRQWVSWISMDDEIGAIHHALLSDGLSGPVNVVAPGAGHEPGVRRHARPRAAPAGADSGSGARAQAALRRDGRNRAPGKSAALVGPPHRLGLHLPAPAAGGGIAACAWELGAMSCEL